MFPREAGFRATGIVQRLSRALLASCFLSTLLAACAGVDYEISRPTRLELLEAERDIARHGKLEKNAWSKAENLKRLERVVKRVSPAAERLCQALGEVRDCTFQVLHLNSREFNAYATREEDAGKYVYLTLGALEFTHSDDEIAFILAHEYGHLIGNHTNEAAIPPFAKVLASTRVAGWINRIAFDRDQESEADLFATRLVLDAGYDLDKAYRVLITLAVLSEPSEGFLSTHPSGPRRLASARRHLREEAFVEISGKEEAYPQAGPEDFRPVALQSP